MGKWTSNRIIFLRIATHFIHQLTAFYLAPYRAYDPGTGRWLSRDPLGFVDGPNLYAYVLNNPVNLVDHTGLSFTSPEPFVMIGELDLPGGALERASRTINAGDRMAAELAKRHQRPGFMRRGWESCKRNARSLKAWIKSAGFSARPKPPNPLDQLLSEEGAEAMGGVFELERRGLRERNQLLANPECPAALNNYKKRTSGGQ